MNIYAQRTVQQCKKYKSKPAEHFDGAKNAKAKLANCSAGEKSE